MVLAFYLRVCLFVDYCILKRAKKIRFFGIDIESLRGHSLMDFIWFIPIIVYEYEPIAIMEVIMVDIIDNLAVEINGGGREEFILQAELQLNWKKKTINEIKS